MSAAQEESTLKNQQTQPIDDKTVATISQNNLLPLNQQSSSFEFDWEQFPEKYANTAPLGLLSFGMTTVMLSFCNVNLYKMNSMIMGMGFFYGGMTQFIAGTFEIREGHTFGGTVFCSFGAFWWSFCTIVFGPVVFGTAEANGKAVGTYLLFWCVFALFMLGALLKHGTISEKVIFATLALTFLFLSISEYADSKVVKRIGGGFGLFCGVVAIYAGLAQVINGDQGSSVLPI